MTAAKQQPGSPCPVSALSYSSDFLRNIAKITVDKAIFAGRSLIKSFL